MFDSCALSYNLIIPKYQFEDEADVEEKRDTDYSFQQNKTEN